MSETEKTDIDELEKMAELFLENRNKLEELSSKVSREGLRRIFIATTQFPYVGDNFKVKNAHEANLMQQSLFMKDLASKIAALQPLEEIQNEVVDNMVESVKETLTQTQGE